MLKIEKIGLEYSLVAEKDIEIGQTIINIEDGTYSIYPDKYTVRVWDEKTCVHHHIDHPLIRNMNHSCDPNTVFKGFDIIAIANIKADTEVTFDYHSTEKHITTPFECACGSRYCKVDIK